MNPETPAAPPPSPTIEGSVQTLDGEVDYLRGPEGGPVAFRVAPDAWEKFDSIRELAESMEVSVKAAKAALAKLPPCDYARADVDAYYGWWAWAALAEDGRGYLELWGGEWDEPQRSTFGGGSASLKALVLGEVIGSCEEYCGLTGDPKPRKTEYYTTVLRCIGKESAPLKTQKPRKAKTAPARRSTPKAKRPSRAR